MNANDELHVENTKSMFNRGNVRVVTCTNYPIWICKAFLQDSIVWCKEYVRYSGTVGNSFKKRIKSTKMHNFKNRWHTWPLHKRNCCRYGVVVRKWWQLGSAQNLDESYNKCEAKSTQEYNFKTRRYTTVNIQTEQVVARTWWYSTYTREKGIRKN